MTTDKSERIGRLPASGPMTGTPFLEYLPQYHCPRCEGAIAGECVQSTWIGEVGCGRIVRVWCDHCTELFEAVLRLEPGGIYSVEEQPKLVADHRIRRRFLDKLAKLRGDVVLPVS